MPNLLAGLLQPLRQLHAMPKQLVLLHLRLRSSSTVNLRYNLLGPRDHASQRLVRLALNLLIRVRFDPDGVLTLPFLMRVLRFPKHNPKTHLHILPSIL